MSETVANVVVWTAAFTTWAFLGRVALYWWRR